MPTAWGSRSFNGTTDQISLGTFTLPSRPVTIAAWHYPTDLTTSAYGTIHDRPSGGAHYMAMFAKNSSPGHMAYYGSGTGIDPGSGTITINNWYHAGFSADSVGNGTAYLNGVFDGSQTTQAPTTNGANTVIGNSTANNPYFGRIADLALWNVALTAAEFAALAKGARPSQIRPGNLVFYLPLDGLQSPEADLSTNVRNGTLTGTTAAFGPPYAPLTPRWPQFLTPPAGGGSAIKFRKTLSQIGGRVGMRQPIGWGM